MTSIRLGGMTVDSEGEGPPIVMLHGLGGTSNSFQAMVPPLAGFRIVRPDLRGAGRSRAEVKAAQPAKGYVGRYGNPDRFVEAIYRSLAKEKR